MKKMIIFCLGFLLIFIQCIPDSMDAQDPRIAIAATSSKPKATVSDLTLYAGNKTYQIQFDNLKKNSSLSFKSSANSIAKVSNTGIITPILKGKAVITVTIKQGNKKYISKINIIVDNPNIKITSKKKELIIGENYTFKAKVYGIKKDIIWSVSDESVAEIDSNNGKLIAIAEGEVDVIATAGFISSSCTVTVGQHVFTANKKTIECYEPTTVYITDEYEEDTLSFTVGDAKIIKCDLDDTQLEGNKFALLITPKKIGSTTITVTSNKAPNKIVINVTVVKIPIDKAVPTVTTVPVTPAVPTTSSPSVPSVPGTPSTPLAPPSPVVTAAPTVPTITAVPTITSPPAVSSAPTVTPEPVITAVPTEIPIPSVTETPTYSAKPLSADRSYVIFQSPTTVTVYITDENLNDGITCTGWDTNIVTCSWGSCDGSSSYPLQITPINVGITEITIYSDKAPNTIVITILVSSLP